MNSAPTPRQSGHFDNRFLRELPGDPEARNFRRQVQGACYSRVDPTPIPEPRLLAFSPEMVDELQLPVAPEEQRFAEVFGGNALLPGMEPFAMCYGGHQFGTWAGQLGDGRAINLGEWINRAGRRWVLQLKGAGPTPYSRTADGLAVLRSSLREFLCSEAMHHLGIPTTRALSLVGTGQSVVRDMFYDGNPEREPGAVTCRVSPSFIRFGNFEIFAARQEDELLQRLIDYTIATDFPHLDTDADDRYVQWFAEICQRTAEMIIHWMRVGFVHGVMNTDNMSILGLTIDYGPYGWLEGYDPVWTPNTTDAHGRRYCYGQQPQIAMWNLVQLANALMPVIDDKEGLQSGINLYADQFRDGWQATLAAKLGLRNYDPEQDDALVENLWQVLQSTETDMTIFFRRLAEVPCESPLPETPEESVVEVLEDAFYQPEELTGEVRRGFVDWLHRYRLRATAEGRTDAARAAAMRRVNPKYVLRNYLAQLAIDRAAEGDCQLIDELLEVMRHPYDEQPEYERYAAKRPEWARHKAGCSMLSCSS
jgi:uncharacterized protein YdiU (UPF0061 family)